MGANEWYIVAENAAHWYIGGANEWYIVAENTAHWYIGGANGWRSVGENGWHIVRANRWCSLAANIWLILGANTWHIAGRNLTAEQGTVLSVTGQTWLTTSLSLTGSVGPGYLHGLPDVDRLYQTTELTLSPRVELPLYVTQPGTYTVWVRGYALNAASDSLYVGVEEQVVGLTGLPPDRWGWANLNLASGEPVTLSLTSAGFYTVSVWMREDGLRIDRLLLTTDTTFIPTGVGPAESDRQPEGLPGLMTQIERVIDYDYDGLYRLLGADYSTGEAYSYSYDPVGNRLAQIIAGDTTSYQYDAANRLAQVTTDAGTESYVFDDNGNLLETGTLTNTFDAANRLVETTRDGSTLQPLYDGVNNRVAQTEGLSTTFYALDVALGLPEVLHTSEGHFYLHLPGVTVAYDGGETRYLLSDGLGSVRQAVDDTGTVMAYNEFDPYGSPVQTGEAPYGFTGEWWEEDVALLH